MRYRSGEDGALTPVDASSDLVTATVVFTLVIGIVFLLAGLRGRQNWLQFCGGLTWLCCAAYFMRGWLR